MHRSQNMRVDFAERCFHCLLGDEVDFRCGWCFEDGWRMDNFVQNDRVFHSCCRQHWWHLMERFAWMVLHCFADDVGCWNSGMLVARAVAKHDSVFVEEHCGGHGDYYWSG